MSRLLLLFFLGCQSAAAWWLPHPKPLVMFGSYHLQKQHQQSPPLLRRGEEKGGLLVLGETTTATQSSSPPPSPPQRSDGGRRAALFSVVLTATSAIGGCHGRFGVLPVAWAATEGPAAAASSSSAARTVYKSGKAPLVPGVPPRDKSEVKGTKRDPDFLRSISDCKSQCQSAGDGSFAKSKEDCLSECQDICCRTYEQCTFDIVPRI